MRVLDLFSGLGGWALAGSWVWGRDHDIAAFVEINPFCRNILRRHWPEVPIFEDVKTFHYEGEQIDLLTASPPCQSASCAGKRRGTSDDRWLWGEALRILGETKPEWAIFENVRGLLTLERGMVFEGLLTEMETLGYETRTFVIPACGVGAPHKRDRVWITANKFNRNPNDSNAREIRKIQKRSSKYLRSLGAAANTSGRRLGRQGDREIQQPGRAEAERTDRAFTNPASVGWGPQRAESTGQQGPSGVGNADSVFTDSTCKQLDRARDSRETGGRESTDGGVFTSDTSRSNDGGYIREPESRQTSEFGERLEPGDDPDSEREGLQGRMRVEPLRHAGLSDRSWSYEKPDWKEDWLSVTARTCRVYDGLPGGVDNTGRVPAVTPPKKKSAGRSHRLKALGNSIVPHIAATIMQAIKDTDFLK